MTSNINTAAFVPPSGSQGGFSDNPHRGIASLQFNNRTLRFRTNPNEIWWTYGLNTHVEETYGGRVVQILSVSIRDLIVKVECGRGGWQEAQRIVEFLRRMMIDQRKSERQGGGTAIFNYTTRRWRMKVYALSVPFQDRVTEVNRELTLQFKVQEDISGVMSSMALSQELKRMQDGIGWKKTQYNDPKVAGGGGPFGESPAWGIFGENPGNLLGGVNPLPGQTSIFGGLGIPGIG